MAKALCVILCVCVTLQTVLCQFGFFPQRENQNFFGQGLLQTPNRIREGLLNVFRPNQQRPVMNQQRPQDNIYIIETDQPINDNYNPNSGTKVIFVEEQDGNVNFNKPNQNGFQPDQGNNNFQPNQDNNGFQNNQDNNGFQPNPDNNGFQPNQGNEGSQNNGVNFNDRNQGGDGFQENTQEKGQEDASVPENDPVKFEDTPKSDEGTTLPPLTPVPVVQTDSRNNFGFGTPPPFGESCETVDGGLGSCISIYNCQPYLKIIQESRTQAMQILRRAHCGFEGNNPKVCCPRPGIPTAAPTPAPRPTTTTTVPPPTQTPSSKTSLADFVDYLPDPPLCGLSNASFSRVVGGIDAKLGDFPWMALLGYKSRRGGTNWLCGGSLVSSRHVLTAAHCIHNHEDDLYVVRLGELDLAREDEGATPVDVLIKQKIKHEQYSASAYTNDIAVLILERDVQFTDLIRPICIPKDSEMRARSFEDYNPLIAGWGQTEFRGPSATHLQVLQLPVVSNDFCKQAYSAYKAQQIDQRVLCAGFKKGGKDSCQGDSGGPLMQPIYSAKEYKTYFYQIGVVSFGKKCAEPGFPGVYSRVTHFVPWIEEKVLGRVISR
ncbi:venom serine protease Bi-VSP-like [Anticarsia gemmatalis]|uniref:venom serine protease Bi-VSP-like n=1 Tax=Anticarsia gemmatalis TaxID=129554 RepID=UPI003F75BC8C